MFQIVTSTPGLTLAEDGTVQAIDDVAANMSGLENVAEAKEATDQVGKIVRLDRRAYVKKRVRLLFEWSVKMFVC
jgi:hypothetical protein